MIMSPDGGGDDERDEAQTTGSAAEETAIGPDEPPSEAIVRLVAAATGRRSLELTPLYGSTDPDALDALFGRRSDGSVRTEGSLRFRYEGCEVIVDGRTVRVRRLPGENGENGEGTESAES
jgi:hypothetical protein